jgi:hypothetical protein
MLSMSTRQETFCIPQIKLSIRNTDRRMANGPESSCGGHVDLL